MNIRKVLLPKGDYYTTIHKPGQAKIDHYEVFC